MTAKKPISRIDRRFRGKPAIPCARRSQIRDFVALRDGEQSTAMLFSTLQTNLKSHGLLTYSIQSRD